MTDHRELPDHEVRRLRKAMQIATAMLVVAAIGAWMFAALISGAPLAIGAILLHLLGISYGAAAIATATGDRPVTGRPMRRARRRRLAALMAATASLGAVALVLHLLDTSVAPIARVDRRLLVRMHNCRPEWQVRAEGMSAPRRGYIAKIVAASVLNTVVGLGTLALLYAHKLLLAGVCFTVHLVALVVVVRRQRRGGW